MKRTFIILLVIVFLVPAASGNAEVLFEDNFDDGDYAGWTHILGADGGIEPEAWTVQNGHLQSIASSSAQNVRADNLYVPTSFIFEFETRSIVDGGGWSLIGVYLHWDGWANRVEIGYRPGRIYMKQVVNNVGYKLQYAQNLPEIDPTQWHKFRLEREDTLCSLYLDEELILEYELSVGVSGGSLVLAGGPGTRQFDNVIASKFNGVCISDSTELQSALTTAASNGEDDVIRIVQGTYNGNFIYASTESFGVTLEGGYTAGCASRTVDPNNTVLDAGGSGTVLALSATSAVADLVVDGLTVTNGSEGGIRISCTSSATVIYNIVNGNGGGFLSKTVHTQTSAITSYQTTLAEYI